MIRTKSRSRSTRCRYGAVLRPVVMVVREHATFPVRNWIGPPPMPRRYWMVTIRQPLPLRRADASDLRLIGRALSAATDSERELAPRWPTRERTDAPGCRLRSCWAWVVALALARIRSVVVETTSARALREIRPRFRVPRQSGLPMTLPMRRLQRRRLEALRQQSGRRMRWSRA